MSFYFRSDSYFCPYGQNGITIFIFVQTLFTFNSFTFLRGFAVYTARIFVVKKAGLFFLALCTLAKKVIRFFDLKARY